VLAEIYWFKKVNLRTHSHSDPSVEMGTPQAKVYNAGTVFSRPNQAKTEEK
jgi:hypothetical protein